MDYMTKSGVIIDQFPIHLPEREHIEKSWNEYRWRLSWGMIAGSGFLKNFQPINFIKDYYGEKFGFYFSWLIHYAGWLIPVALIGFVIGVIMIVIGIQDGLEWNKLFAHPLNIIYAFFIMIWITCFHESWKRKQAFIGNEWLVRNIKDASIERSDFMFEATIDPDTAHAMKIASKKSYERQMCIGVPLSLLCMAGVILAQCLL